MQQVDKTSLRFVRTLLGGATGKVVDDTVVAVVGDKRASIPLNGARVLLSQGVLFERGGVFAASNLAPTWLKRQMLEQDAYAAQHREEVTKGETLLNLAESPLLRLATAKPGEPAFLEAHQVEAGERLRRLTERAQLQPRVTMSYSQTHTASGGAGQAADVSEMAADARRKLRTLHEVLPRDCAGVVLDVCGLGKGLQLVEQERGWPRRSAKLVLRIGLEQLASHWGLAATAVGVESRKRRVWLEDGAVPTEFR